MWYNMSMFSRQLVKDILKKELIVEGDRILVAFSGGPDSLCLLLLLLEIKKKLNFDIICVHVNHGFRQEAIDDEKFCKSFCETRNVKYISFKFDCNAIANTYKLSPEEAGRIARYTAFGQVFQSLRREGIAAASIKLATGHHMNDQAETLLMRMLRGTGVRGLAGIGEKACTMIEGLVAIRPLLGLQKKEILEILRQGGYNYCIDHTNSESKYLRNKIRNWLIPDLQEHYNPKVIESLSRLSTNCKDMWGFLNEHAEKAFRDAVEVATENNVIMDVLKLKNTHKIVRALCLDKAYEQIRTGRKLPEDLVSERQDVSDLKSYPEAIISVDIQQGMGLSAYHYEVWDRLLDSDNPSFTMDLPDQIVACRQYDKVKLFKAVTDDENQINSAEQETMKRSEISVNEMFAEIRNNNKTEVMQLPIAIVSQKDVSSKEENMKKNIAHVASNERVNYSNSHSLKYSLKYTIFFDSAQLDNLEKSDGPMKLRHRLAGDYIKLKGGGRKKLQNYFVDEKIPRHERDKVWLLACGRRIIWSCYGENSRFHGDFKTRLDRAMNLDINEKSVEKIEIIIR